jgi:hypothetical protein
MHTMSLHPRSEAEWLREVNLKPTAPQTMTATELMALDLPPASWVIPDILPEGVTLLVGKPKKGKSWMGLGLCDVKAAGGVAFGIKKVQQGESLYLALEDNQRRLRKRLHKVLDGRKPPEGMHVHTEWPRIGEGGAEALDEWLENHPTAHLVVIDTLAKIRPNAHGSNFYKDDYQALEKLLPLAAEHGVAIVVIHHLRKGAATDAQDEISGSTGLSGGVDGFMILRRTPGSKGPTLYVDGRDIEEPEEYALHWNLNTATWTIEGTAEEVQVSKERSDILLTLNRSPEAMTPREVTDAIPNAKHNNVKVLMHKMLGDGQLIKYDRGRYSPANPTNPGNPGNLGSEGNGLSGDANPGNPGNGHRHNENGSSVTGVTDVRWGQQRGDFDPPTSGDDPHRGSEDKGSTDFATNGIKPALAASGSAPGEAGGGNDVAGKGAPEQALREGWYEEKPARAAGTAQELLEDPPDWLAVQLRKCRDNPRLVNPTANSVANVLYGSPHRWREVLPLVMERAGLPDEAAEVEQYEARVKAADVSAETSDLFRYVIDNGGIRPSSDDLGEEYREIPNAYRRCDGLRGDEMADQHASDRLGLGIRSERDLLEFFATRHHRAQRVCLPGWGGAA